MAINLSGVTAVICIHSEREYRRVFENEADMMTCPEGNSSQQTWTKQGNGTHGTDLSIYDSNPTAKSYIINRTDISDEGIYVCSEGLQPLLFVNLEVEGKRFTFLIQL